MKNSLKTSTNYYNSYNRQYPLNKRLYGALKTDPSNYNEEASKKNLMHLSNFEMYDNILSKALSKKKRRGILDISSLGNKDVLTDSDSEVQTNRNTKNEKIIENNKKTYKKNRCAKLIIEKIESQGPKINEEYYKFTNQKKKNIWNNGNNKYNNNKIKRIYSPFNEDYLNSFNNNQINQINNNKNINSQSRVYTNPKGFQNQQYLNSRNRNNNYISNNKKDVLTTDSSTNDNNYNYMNKKFDKNKYNLNNSVNRNILNGLNKNNNNYYQIKYIPLHSKSSAISIDKVYNSKNNMIYKSNIKDNNVTDNTDYDFSTPVHSSIYNDESAYPSKRAIGLKINLAPYKKHQKTISMYNNYNNLLKKPNINELINLNYNTKSNKSYLQNKFNEKLIKSITKIQSFWRGAFIRELMTFVGKINRFFDILYNKFLNHKKKNFYFFLNNIKNIENPEITKIKVEKKFTRPSMRHRYILNNEKQDKLKKYIKNEEIKKYEDDDVVKKEDNNKKYKKIKLKYNEEKKLTDNDSNNDDINSINNTLLKNYNSLMAKYNKLKEDLDKMNKNKKFENLDIDKNELVIIDKKMKKVVKDEKIDNKNIKINKKDIKNNNSKVKKKIFDIIIPEQKEEFKIIPKNNTINNNNLRYRNQNKIEKIEKVSEIKFESKNENKNINYDDYLNHFNSNINFSKYDYFIIKEIPKINKKILNLIPFDISNNSLSLINNKKIKSLDKNPGDKNILFEEKSKLLKKFENISINKNQENDLSIINTQKKEKKKKSKGKKPEKNQKSELIKTENHKNLNTETKGFENKKLKIFNDCIVFEHNNNINIIQIKKQKEFDKNQIQTKNNIILNIINEGKPQAELNNKNKTFTFSEKSLIFNKIIKLKILGNIQTKIINNDKNDNIKNKELIVEKIYDILLKEEKNKFKKFEEILMIDNNNILYVKRKKKIKCDKMTEITEELNKIEPNNHYELIFKGKINFNENIDNMNIEKNNNKQKNEISAEINLSLDEKKKKNYNEENEIDKGEGLEINPLEIKKNKLNNIIISYENKIEVLYNKNSEGFTEKAKKNMMKIILPIRLKTVLREYNRKNVFQLLIKRLKIKK